MLRSPFPKKAGSVSSSFALVSSNIWATYTLAAAANLSKSSVTADVWALTDALTPAIKVKMSAASWLPLLVIRLVRPATTYHIRSIIVTLFPPFPTFIRQGEEGAMHLLPEIVPRISLSKSVSGGSILKSIIIWSINPRLRMLASCSFSWAYLKCELIRDTMFLTYQSGENRAQVSSRPYNSHK